MFTQRRLRLYLAQAELADFEGAFSCVRLGEFMSKEIRNGLLV